MWKPRIASCVTVAAHKERKRPEFAYEWRWNRKNQDFSLWVLKFVHFSGPAGQYNYTIIRESALDFGSARYGSPTKTTFLSDMMTTAVWWVGDQNFKGYNVAELNFE